MAGLSPHCRCIAWRRSVWCATFQIVRELSGLTVLENLLLAPVHQRGEAISGTLFSRSAVRHQEQDNASKARAILKRIGLWKLADQSASALSGGQKKIA